MPFIFLFVFASIGCFLLYLTIKEIIKAKQERQKALREKAEAEKRGEVFCVDCKHCIGEDAFSKCLKFPNNKESTHKELEDYLVTGIKKVPKTDFWYCSICRWSEDRCTKTGKYFEKKV